MKKIVSNYYNYKFYNFTFQPWKCRSLRIERSPVSVVCGVCRDPNNTSLLYMDL